ncbi:MAG: hypothetical protein MJZ26_05945 [Fibrobacter sp.]|nr:hypothetical protein [Fibrobacter sp.]
MSSENTNPVIYSNRTIVRGFLVVVVVAGLLLILPLYMQNRISRLYIKSHELSEEIGRLQRQILVQELEMNKLSSLEALSEYGEETGLGLNDVPTKVRVVGGAR